MAVDLDRTPEKCGGVNDCITCRTVSQAAGTPKDPTSRCKIDSQLKKINLLDGTFKVGRIPWCTTHLTPYDGGLSTGDKTPSCPVRLEAFGLTTEILQEFTVQTETLEDLLLSISENLKEMSEAFAKIAPFIKHGKD
jgi:hypothetical protein